MERAQGSFEIVKATRLKAHILQDTMVHQLVSNSIIDVEDAMAMEYYTLHHNEELTYQAQQEIAIIQVVAFKTNIPIDSSNPPSISLYVHP